MADQLLAGLPPVIDFNGDVVAGGSVTFYQTGTTTPVAIFSDVAATIPLTNPLTLDSAGRPSSQIFYVGTVAVKEVIKDAGGATLYTVDPSPRFSITAAAASGVTYSPIANNPTTNVQAAIDYVSNLSVSTIPALAGSAGKALFVDGAATAFEFASVGGIYCTATGSDAIALTTGLSLSGKSAGDQLYWMQAATNVGAVTIAVDGGLTAPLKLNNGSAVPAGKLILGDFHAASYDGTNWVLNDSTGLDGTVIGGKSPAAGSFTTVTAGTSVFFGPNVQQLYESGNRVFLNTTDGVTNKFMILGDQNGTLGHLGGSLNLQAGAAGKALLGSSNDFTLYDTLGTTGKLFWDASAERLTVPNLTATSVDINGGNIDGTTIGAASPAAGSFTSAKVADGTLALPSIAFTADPDTGFYRVTNGRFDAVNNGVSTVIFGTGTTTFANLTATTADINAGTIDGTSIGNTVQANGSFAVTTATRFRGPLGAAATPIYSFTDDDDTGMYRNGVNGIGFSTGGALAASIFTTGFDGAIGGTTPAAGTFTNLNSSNATFTNGGGSSVTTSFASAAVGANFNINYTTTGPQAIVVASDGGVLIGDLTSTTADINGGTIDGTTIGATTPANGTFTGVYLGGTGAANYLTDYEEGTWTPAITDLTNSATASTAVGTYTKVGNSVHIQGRIALSSLGSVTGTVYLSGFPFNSKSLPSNFGALTVGRAAGLNITSGSAVVGDLRVSLNYVILSLWDATTGNTNLQATELTASGDISFSMDYLTN